MTDPRGAPRRVSLGYILGFSDKPFKDPKLPAPPPSPPRPKKPSQLTSLVSSPGGIVEWTASDGRKGRLTGTGKPRLTAASLAKVPSETRSTKDVLDTKPASNKAADNGKGAEDKDGKIAAVVVQQQAATGGDAQVNEAPAAAPAANGHAKKSNDSSTWTKEQDEKLMQMKTDNANLPWSAVAMELDKTVPECKARFGIIKSKEGGKGGGKKKNLKGDNQNQGQTGNQNEKKDEGKKEEDKKDEEKKDEGKKEEDKKDEEKKEEDPADTLGMGLDALLGENKEDKEDEPDKAKDQDAWGTGNDGWNTTKTGDAAKNGWEATNTGGTDGANDIADAWGTTGGTGGWAHVDTGAAWDIPIGGEVGDKKDVADAWGNNNWGGDAGAATSEDTTKDQNDAAAGGVLASTWDTVGVKDNNTNNSAGGGGIPVSNKGPGSTANNPASFRHSTKAPSQSHSHHSAPINPKSNPNRPLELEIKPDDVFSADDLRLVARILQQDCSMVWNRVSWRFRDKTGRTLHPDVFEKKITGQLEGKGSDKSERRK